MNCVLITKQRSERTFWLVCMYDNKAFLRLMSDYKFFPKETMSEAELIEFEPYKYNMRYVKPRITVEFEYFNAPILPEKYYNEFLDSCEDEIIKVKLQNYLNHYESTKTI